MLALDARIKADSTGFPVDTKTEQVCIEQCMQITTQQKEVLKAIRAIIRHSYDMSGLQNRRFDRSSDHTFATRSDQFVA